MFMFCWFWFWCLYFRQKQQNSSNLFWDENDGNLLLLAPGRTVAWYWTNKNTLETERQLFIANIVKGTMQWTQWQTVAFWTHKQENNKMCISVHYHQVALHEKHGHQVGHSRIQYKYGTGQRWYLLEQLVSLALKKVLVTLRILFKLTA